MHKIIDYSAKNLLHSPFSPSLLPLSFTLSSYYFLFLVTNSSPSPSLCYTSCILSLLLHRLLHLSLPLYPSPFLHSISPSLRCTLVSCHLFLYHFVYLFLHFSLLLFFTLHTLSLLSFLLRTSYLSSFPSSLSPPSLSLFCCLLYSSYHLSNSSLFLADLISLLSLRIPSLTCLFHCLMRISFFCVRPFFSHHVPFPRLVVPVAPSLVRLPLPPFHLPYLRFCSMYFTDPLPTPHSPSFLSPRLPFCLSSRIFFFITLYLFITIPTILLFSSSASFLLFSSSPSRFSIPLLCVSSVLTTCQLFYSFPYLSFSDSHPLLTFFLSPLFSSLPFLLFLDLDLISSSFIFFLLLIKGIY